MGGWKLEVCKMFIYISFPVFCFHYFNKPGNFDEAVQAWRNQIDATTNKEGNKMLLEFFKKQEEIEAQKSLKAMESGQSTF